MLCHDLHLQLDPSMTPVANCTQRQAGYRTHEEQRAVSRQAMDAPLYVAKRISRKENGADQGAQPAERAAVATQANAQLMR